jgi:alpha-N-acetylglucosamine transferase
MPTMPTSIHILARVSGAALFLMSLIGWYLLAPASRSDLLPVLEPPALPVVPSNAYVFYATSNTYACSALVNAHIIRNVLKSTVPIYLLASPGLGEQALSTITNSPVNITVVPDIAPPLAPNSAAYYSEVLLKLRAFQLHHVNPALKRVIVLDSDQLVRKNLDHLFDLPEADVAAPQMYWGDSTGVTTTLMVAELNDELWGIVDGALQHMRPDEYDMDLINRVLQRRLMILPGRYCTLNSHWENNDLPGWFKGYKTEPAATPEELVELYEEVEVLHFTAMEKPWNVSPDKIVPYRKILGKSEVHPLFVEQFREWHTYAKDLCPFWQFVEPAPPQPPNVLLPPPSQPPATTTEAASSELGSPDLAV